jgi:hypothetical protein
VKRSLGKDDDGEIKEHNSNKMEINCIICWCSWFLVIMAIGHQFLTEDQVITTHIESGHINIHLCGLHHQPLQCVVLQEHHPWIWHYVAKFVMDLCSHTTHVLYNWIFVIWWCLWECYGNRSLLLYMVLLLWKWLAMSLLFKPLFCLSMFFLGF